MRFIDSTLTAKPCRVLNSGMVRSRLKIANCKSFNSSTVVYSKSSFSLLTKALILSSFVFTFVVKAHLMLLNPSLVRVSSTSSASFSNHISKRPSLSVSTSSISSAESVTSASTPIFDESSRKEVTTPATKMASVSLISTSTVSFLLVGASKSTENSSSK